MDWGSGTGAARSIDDGLGTRVVETDRTEGGTVEVLEVSPSLAAHPGFEDAIRSRVSRIAELNLEGVARVHRVERRGTALRVIAEHVEGLRLPDLLDELIKIGLPLPQNAALDLAWRVLNVAASLHRVPGLSHGAIAPAHIVVTRAGTIVLTDAVFGTALELLQRNREELWREFRLAFPVSASLPRFDQRADVAQLGAAVLAIMLGRPLRAGEYPRAINHAVTAATLAARPGESGTSASGLRMWLQEALHLHPRAAFASAVDAEHAYAQTLGILAERRGGAATLDDAVRRLYGDTAAADEVAELAADWSRALAGHHVPVVVPPIVTPPAHHVPVQRQVSSVGALGSLLRSVFPRFRAS